MTTIYECCQPGKDVNRTLRVVHYADTQAEAISWLERNGGGVYRNQLHKFQMRVDPVPARRGKTEAEAITAGMRRETDLTQATTHCPECGCPWFGDRGYSGPGHRTCFDCWQDWYTDVSYAKQAPLRELPSG